MVLFIFFCILAAIALVTFVVALVVPRELKGEYDTYHPRRIVRFSATGVLTIGLVLLFFASFTTVGTKNLGVLTTFGRPTGSVDNGFHWKAPWQNVTELTDRVQTDTYASDGGSNGKKQEGAVATCINVRIARQATACVNVSIRWQIREDGVDYLFRNFKDNDAITDNLVLRDLQTVMNKTLVDYDPLGIDTNGNNTNKPLSSSAGNDLSSDVLTEMKGEIGTWIDVQSVNIPLLTFDSATQDKINQLIQQIAATRVAQQAQQTAIAQAAANQALAASVSNSPGVLESKCLDILKEAVDKGQALPAGFSCFGPASTSIAVGK